MKLLLNVNISPSLIGLLDKEKFQCRHAALIGIATASDAEIVDEARKNNEVILTHDLDYAALLGFSNQNKPSVIIFRIQPLSTQGLLKIFSENISHIEKSLLEGALLVIDNEKIRVRKLPMKV